MSLFFKGTVSLNELSKVSRKAVGIRDRAFSARIRAPCGHYNFKNYKENLRNRENSPSLCLLLQLFRYCKTATHRVLHINCVILPPGSFRHTIQRVFLTEKLPVRSGEAREYLVHPDSPKATIETYRPRLIFTTRLLA